MDGAEMGSKRPRAGCADSRGNYGTICPGHSGPVPVWRAQSSANRHSVTSPLGRDRTNIPTPDSGLGGRMNEWLSGSGHHQAKTVIFVNNYSVLAVAHVF